MRGVDRAEHLAVDLAVFPECSGVDALTASSTSAVTFASVAACCSDCSCSTQRAKEKFWQGVAGDQAAASPATKPRPWRRSGRGCLGK